MQQLNFIDSQQLRTKVIKKYPPFLKKTHRSKIEKTCGGTYIDLPIIIKLFSYIPPYFKLF